MFDASSDALVDVAPIHFKNSAGEFAFAGPGLPCRVHLFGPGTDQFTQVEQRQSQRALKRMENNDGKIAIASAEVRAAELAEDLAEVTSHFENFGYQGQPLTADRFRAFYSDKKVVHYHRQVVKALADTGNWQPGATGA